MTKSERKINDEDIIRGITEFEANYLSLDKDRLVLFTVDFLESRKIEPTFDKIVVTAFKLFPKKFSLIGFPEYPDGRTIYYCAYNHCTLTKRWLSGNVQSAFKVTERGRYFLDETKKMLEGKIKSTRLHESIPRRKEATFINALKKTDAYKKYIDGRKEEITKSEIYETLKAPQYSNELVQSHLERYFDYANRIQDSNATEFLKFIRRKLKGEKDA
jgi:hypothetical protein